MGGGNIVLPGLTWRGLPAKVAAGTTALVVVFASLSGFLGHMALGGLDTGFLAVMAVLAGGGSLAGSHVMQTRLTSTQLKRLIGVLLWVIAAKMALDLVGCIRPATGVHRLPAVAASTTPERKTLMLLFLGHGVEPQAANGGWFIPPVVVIIVPMVLVPLVPWVPAVHLLLLISRLRGLGHGLPALCARRLPAVLPAGLPPPARRPPRAVPVDRPRADWVGGLALLGLAHAGAPLWGELRRRWPPYPRWQPPCSGVRCVVAGGGLALLGAYLRRGTFPYGLGWWAFTFPLGAFTADTLALGRAWQVGLLEALAVLLFIVLVIFWLVVTAGTLRAVRSGRVWVSVMAGPGAPSSSAAGRASGSRPAPPEYAWVTREGIDHEQLHASPSPHLP